MEITMRMMRIKIDVDLKILFMGGRIPETLYLGVYHYTDHNYIVDITKIQ